MKTALILLLLTSLISVSSFAKDRIGSDTFNKMIDEGNTVASATRSSIHRTITSTEANAAFPEEVISAANKNRNPVKYNPFLYEDDVEVSAPTRK